MIGGFSSVDGHLSLFLGSSGGGHGLGVLRCLRADGSAGTGNSSILEGFGSGSKRTRANTGLPEDVSFCTVGAKFRRCISGHDVVDAKRIEVARRANS